MGLFKTDLYRSFLIGFAVGAVIVATTVGLNGGLSNSVAPRVEARGVE